MFCVYVNLYENEVFEKYFLNLVEEFENVFFVFFLVDGEYFEKRCFDNYDKFKMIGGCFFKFFCCNMDGVVF